MLSPVFLEAVSFGLNCGLEFAPRVGEEALSLIVATRPRGVQLSASVVSIEALANVDGVGVDCLSGDGDAGDSGLRKGEVRGDPKERGDGLYEADMDWKVR